MCGIAGFLYNGITPEKSSLGQIAESMTNRLVHRGPDASGVWTDVERGVALGHRRLSIIDLSQAGAQPMASASGRYLLTYNGEIYNFPSLRRELEADDYPFAGHSDTEVLVAAIENWGVDKALKRINGMFAFAVWDRKECVLTLARDRVGKKPLYYGWCNGVFLFASELKAIRFHPEFDDALDYDALGRYIQYGWLAQPASIYRHIRKLPPASFIQIRKSNNPWSVTPQKYWAAGNIAISGVHTPYGGSYEQALNTVEGLLRESVDERMVADVDLGALLSGGIDSSLIVSLMQLNSDRPVRTYSIGFWEPKYNEAEYAAQIANHVGTRHRELYVTPEQCLSVVEQIPRIYDEPFADISQIPTYLVSKLAREEVKVVLSGDGGDELFAGYTRYFECLKRWQWMHHMPSGVRAALGSIFTNIGQSSWDLFKPHNIESDAKISKWRRQGGKLQRHACYWNANSPQELIANTFTHGIDGRLFVRGNRHPQALFSDQQQCAEISDPLHAMMYYDFSEYLTDDIMVKVDRASMAVGLEVRSPLLDQRLIEFAWSLPNDFLMDEHGGKRILKDILKRHIPQALFDRPKRGFSVPIADWLRGPLRTWAEDLLSRTTLVQQGIFYPDAVRQVWEQHLCRWRNHTNLLWAILMFQTWWFKSKNDGD